MQTFSLGTPPTHRPRRESDEPGLPKRSAARQQQEAGRRPGASRLHGRKRHEARLTTRERRERGTPAMVAAVPGATWKWRK